MFGTFSFVQIFYFVKLILFLKTYLGSGGAPSSQTVGSSFMPPCRQSWLGKWSEHSILQHIYSFGNPVSCGNTEMIKEHRLLLHSLLYHFDHLFITSSDHYLGSHPFYILGSTVLNYYFHYVYINASFGKNIYVCTTDI